MLLKILWVFFFFCMQKKMRLLGPQLALLRRKWNIFNCIRLRCFITKSHCQVKAFRTLPNERVVTQCYHHYKLLSHSSLMAEKKEKRLLYNLYKQCIQQMIMIYFPLVCVIKFSTLKIMTLNTIHEEVKAAEVAYCGTCMAVASSHD